MNIDTLDELLHAARQQSQPQRLLLVFAEASVPVDASTEQRAAFAAGEEVNWLRSCASTRIPSLSVGSEAMRPGFNLPRKGSPLCNECASSWVLARTPGRSDCAIRTHAL